MERLVDSLNSFADHVADMPVGVQLASIALLPIPVYLLVASVFSFVSGEYHASDHVVITRQLKQSVFALLALSPVATAWHYFMLTRGDIGMLYWKVEEFGLPYLALSLLLYLFAMDSVAYWLHRLLHQPFLYRTFHNTHHQYHPTTSFAASAVDVVDVFFDGFLPVCAPPLFFPVHISVFFFFMWFGLVWSVYVHNTHITIVPSLGCFITSADHQIHHKTTKYNYSMFTRFWDVVCGTYMSPDDLIKRIQKYTCSHSSEAA